jgi:hypothetical protein
MKTSVKTMNPEQLFRRRSKIDPKPQYQRRPVWNDKKKQLLIDTIMREFDIPKIYLNEATRGPFDFEVVDGQQRLRAMWDFHDNKFPLGKASKDLPPPLGDLSGKYHRDLTPDQQDVFQLFPVSITEIRSASPREIRMLFLRLQEGESLNPAEKRNAMPGEMRDFVDDLAENHPVFGKINVKSPRFQHQDFAAHVVLIQLLNGATDVKAKNLQQMYEEKEKFDKTSPDARKISRILNYMDRVLTTKPPEMDIKWGFVDLYWAISTLEDDYDLKGSENEVCTAYIRFEKRRRKYGKNPSVLLEPPVSEQDRDLYNYIEAFKKDGAHKNNLLTRYGVYKNMILEGLPGLVPKDPKRAFSPDQRMAIWRRDSCKCKNCGKSIKFNEMEADHVVPHSRGGKTTVDNGQSLCKPCNGTKGASV